MIPSLFWKVRVVPSLILGLSFIFITHSGLSQSSANKQHSKKITVSIRETRIKEAILELERITGLHFVYSSNKIDERIRVTLHASDRSLEEVLGLLAAQANLS